MPVSRDPMLLAGLTVTFLHLELAILRRSQFYRRLAYVAHDPRHAICASVSIEASPPVTAILAPAATVYIRSGTPLIARVLVAYEKSLRCPRKRYLFSGIFSPAYAAELIPIRPRRPVLKSGIANVSYVVTQKTIISTTLQRRNCTLCKPAPPSIDARSVNTPSVGETVVALVSSLFLSTAPAVANVPAEIPRMTRTDPGISVLYSPVTIQINRYAYTTRSVHSATCVRDKL